MSAVIAVVVAEHAERTHDLDARGIPRDEDHRLLAVSVGIGVGLAHHDEDGGIRIHRARRPPFAPVDDVVIAVTADARADVRGVAGSDIGLGHAERRADLRFEQRLQPLLLLLGGAELTQHLHVSGVGGVAVHGRRGQARTPPADLGERCVLEVGQSRTLFAGMEEVPQPLRRASARSSTTIGRTCPVVRRRRQLLFENRLGGDDMLIEEYERAWSSCRVSSRPVRSPCQRPSSPCCASGSTRSPMLVESLADGVAGLVAIVNSLEDHRELVGGEGSIPAQVGVSIPARAA